VDFTQGKLSEQPLNGGAQMRQLALTALAALERADLADATRVLHERVFSRRAEALLECYEEKQTPRWRFKPMAELLLLEVTHLADAPNLSPEERRQRIDWTLVMAGF
jgi:hypothetical protein